MLDRRADLCLPLQIPGFPLARHGRICDRRTGHRCTCNFHLSSHPKSKFLDELLEGTAHCGESLEVALRAGDAFLKAFSHRVRHLILVKLVRHIFEQCSIGHINVLAQEVYGQNSVHLVRCSRNTKALEKRHADLCRNRDTVFDRERLMTTLAVRGQPAVAAGRSHKIHCGTTVLVLATQLCRISCHDTVAVLPCHVDVGKAIARVHAVAENKQRGYSRCQRPISNGARPLPITTMFIL
mmetsp:Transcript_14817/g.29220  ORF Transcript_14817/g.29220 Transcript_14817/m.29220 type:complete len:239 (-) Transcript_14817:194-910(-)